MDVDVRDAQNLAARIETLAQEVAALPDEQGRVKAQELLHALLHLYGAVLARVLAMTKQAESAGPALIEAFARDELVGSLLLLHELHPVDLETRIHQALDRLHATMQAGGHAVTLTSIEDGVAYLWLTGTDHAHGCASSSSALKQRIEQAIYAAAPDLDEIRFEEEAASRRQAVPVKFVPRRRSQKSSPGARPVEVAPGQSDAGERS